MSHDDGAIRVPASWFERPGVMSAEYSDQLSPFVDLLRSLIGRADPVSVSVIGRASLHGVTVEAVDGDLVTLMQRWAPADLVDMLTDSIAVEPRLLPTPFMLWVRLDQIAYVTDQGMGEW